MDVRAATLLELQAEYRRLAVIVTQASNARVEIAAEIERRKRSARLDQRIASMSQSEQEALYAALKESLNL